MSTPTTTAELEARVAKLEEKLEALAGFVAYIVSADDVGLVWDEEVVDEGTPDEWVCGDWHLRTDDGVEMRMECAIGGLEPIGGEVAAHA